MNKAEVRLLGLYRFNQCAVDRYWVRKMMAFDNRKWGKSNTNTFHWNDCNNSLDGIEDHRCDIGQGTCFVDPANKG